MPALSLAFVCASSFHVPHADTYGDLYSRTPSASDIVLLSVHTWSANFSMTSCTTPTSSRTHVMSSCIDITAFFSEASLSALALCVASIPDMVHFMSSNMSSKASDPWFYWISKKPSSSNSLVPYDKHFLSSCAIVAPPPPLHAMVPMQLWSHNVN